MQEDAEFWREQRDALIMQVRAIEKRLGIQQVARCPQCQHKFAVNAKAQRQMGPHGGASANNAPVGVGGNSERTGA